jgi:hypothetical protein
MGGLSAGPIRLVVSHPRYEELKLEEIELMEGESVENLRILLSRGSMVKGHVWDKDMNPMPGENVFVANTMGTSIRNGVTNEDGYYEVSGISKGNYSVTIMPKSFDLEGENFMSSMFNDMKSQMIKLKKDEVRVVDFILGQEDKKGTEVSGVVRQQGRPVEGAILQIHPAGKEVTELTPNMVTTGPDGRYSFAQVEPGAHVILVTVSDQITMGAYSLTSHDVDVPDSTHHKFDINVPGGSLSGTVVDKYTLAPLESVRLMLLNTDEGEEEDLIRELMQGRTAEIYTDKQGRFKITSLGKGNYALRSGGVSPIGVTSGGYARLVVSLHLGKDEQKEGVLIKLEKGGTLEGKVKDAKGMPVSDAVIHLKGPDETDFEPFSDCQTDGSGFFRYEGVPPGKVEVLVKVPDTGEKHGGEVWIEKGQTTTLSVIF